MRLVLLLLLVACGPRNQAPEATPETTPAATPTATPAPAPSPKQDGAAPGASCLRPSECASGVCEGQGCGDDTPGTCVDPAARICTMDLVSYCDCDGVTFQASGTCPGRRVASRGACATE
jgi:hypothetical protein